MDKYQYSKTEFSLIEESCVPMAVYQFIDRRVVTLVLSAGFLKLFGFQNRDEAYYVMDHDMYRDAHPDDVARIADAAFRFATEGEDYNVVYRSKVDNQYRIIHAHGEHIYKDGGIRLAVIWYTDEGVYTPGASKYESDLNRSFNKSLHEETLYQKNYYDYLTGLPNMTYFFELAEAGRRRMLDQGEKPALLFFDLNGMKFYNRKYGFAEGDKLLKEFSKILVAHFSNENCSRFGQDHFAVFTHTEHLEDVLKTIFEECKHINDGKNIPVRVGIYLDEMGAVDISNACDRAKYACDVNQQTYISFFNYFNVDMLETANKHRYIIDHLDEAIREEWIQVYYQPIIRTANGKVCDEEALARWCDPVKGLLSPADFIPALEDAKLIYKLDLYVVEQTLKKMKRMTELGFYIVPTSVNLSRYDFESCDIVEEIRQRVDSAGISRDKINIEITESVIGGDFEFMKKQVERFHKLGFQVWMDDFGSGYSSLDVLQSIHFDLIKFDMRFMMQFDNRDESRIILTELIRMAIGLGVDTICEGVEREEQVAFLREVGCSKLQGFYFCKPVSFETIIERNRTGIAIGFENPEESEYYAAIGRINLYDMAVVAHEDQESFQHYFNTLPMVLIESDGETYQMVRCNKSYRDFARKAFGVDMADQKTNHAIVQESSSYAFQSAMKQCIEDGNRIVLDEELDDGTTVHSFIKRVAVNPVTGIAALVVVVLAVRGEQDQNKGITYGHIARALSSDYFNLFYVNLDTERFIEYSSDTGNRQLAVERHGEDFFKASRKDALRLLHESDREYFVDSFTKENVVRALDEHGTFTLTYRQMIHQEPIYVNLKAVRMNADSHHIIIGVSNVDAQMKHKQALERVQEEQITYARIAALSGGFICIYTVDPNTDHYIEYSATRDYEGLGISKKGEDFFEESRKGSERVIYQEDRDRFLELFTKDRVMWEIEQNGLFVLQYRLVLEGKPVYVSLKGAMVQEKDGPQLIFGVNNIDAQVKREQQYLHSLSVARNKANLDALTGVKNKRVYHDMEEQLNRQITEKQPVPFAIGVFEVKENAPDAQTGERQIKQACAAICTLFKHSPVFRIREELFAVIARGSDYENMEALLEKLEEMNRQNASTGGVVIASGMARYKGDQSAGDVFKRANASMRQNHPSSTEL